MTGTNDKPSPTGTADLLTHVVLASESLGVLDQADNLIRKAATAQGAWIEEFTSLIGPSRSRFRSTYLHWAMAINGLHVAAERYSSKEWQSKNEKFFITGIRPPSSAAILIEWQGDEAAKAHMATLTKMATWGYIEMFAALESTIFEMYRAFLQRNPKKLIGGQDFRDLRKLRDAATKEGADAAAQARWNAAWKERLDAWHRNRLYDGLHKVFLAFCDATKLKTPSQYTNTSIATWSETIEGLALVRHLLIHGETSVPQELEDFCAKPHSMGMSFKTGNPMRIDLFHLQAFELFNHQLLNSLNLAALEHPDAGK